MDIMEPTTPASSSPISHTAAWLLLFGAGVLEIGMAIGLKKSEGLTKLWPSVWGLGLGLASMLVLTLALRTLPAGIGYVVWTGIGSLGVAILAVVMLGEHLSVGKVICMGLIVAGIVGLHLTEHPAAEPMK